MKTISKFLLTFLLLLCLSVPVQTAGQFYSRYVLYDLTGGKRVKTKSFKTLNACMTAGQVFISMECSLIWIQIREPEQKQENAHVLNTCNQDGK